MLCKNFPNLANFEAIRPILFLNDQQCHSIRYYIQKLFEIIDSDPYKENLVSGLM